MAKLQRGYHNKNKPKQSRPIIPTSMVSSREGKFYLQAGKIFFLDEQEVPPEKVPGWVKVQIDNMGEAEKERLGFGKPKPTVTSKKVD